MKFLHIADLHLGKRVCEYSMLDEQRAVLEALVDMAVANDVRAVLIAGDVYDRPQPPVEATALLSLFLERLHDAGVAVLMIAGNHDSGERLAFASGLLRSSRVFVAGECQGRPETVLFEEHGQKIAVHLLPHFRPVALYPYLDGARPASSEEALSLLVKQIDFGAADRHLLLAHLFVDGSATCESESPVIGTVDAVSVGALSRFDYVALGHLHRPQRLGENAVYAGSPLCYSFSEVGTAKSAVLLDVTREGVSSTRLPLVPLHEMREVRGTMAELMAGEYSEDYIKATVTDEDVAPDARITLRTVYPNLMRFAVENATTAFELEVSPANGIENRDPLSLFAEFFEAQNGTPPSEAHLSLMREILQDAEVEQ